MGGFTILFVPPHEPPEVLKIEGYIQSMEDILESKTAEFDYYMDAIIATNSHSIGLPQNEHICNPIVYGSFYIIGNNGKNDDFCSLTPIQIERYKKLFSERLQLGRV